MEYRLSDIFNLQMGKTPSRNISSYWTNGKYSWISISDLNNDKYINKTKEKISIEAVKKSGIKVIPANTVIMSFKLSIGKTAITSQDMYSNEAIMAFINKNKVKLSKDYIYYLLQSINWNTNKAVKGKTVNKSIISTTKVNIPSYKEQLKTAKILDTLIRRLNSKQNQLKKLDELIKARFVEMFGDPVLNSKNFEVSTLSNLGMLGRGRSKHRPRNDPKLLGGKYPLIQTGEVSQSGLYIRNVSNTYSEFGLKQSKLWPKDTLCITIAANIASTSILTFNACFPDSVVGFISNKDKIKPVFLHYWFSFFQNIIESQATQVAQKNINLKVLSNLSVIHPPISLQNEFANFVQQVDKSKVAVQKSLNETQKLYDSLMQEYFG